MAANVQHTYVAGGVVIGPNGQVVVVNQNHNSWSLPKGHIEDSESELQAAKREIREESGLTQLELIGQLGTYTRHRIGLNETEDTRTLKTITLFLFKTDQTELMPQDKDNPEAKWVPVENVADLLTHKKDKEFFLSIVSKIKQMLPQ